MRGLLTSVRALRSAHEESVPSLGQHRPLRLARNCSCDVAGPLEVEVRDRHVVLLHHGEAGHVQAGVAASTPSPTAASERGSRPLSGSPGLERGGTRFHCAAARLCRPPPGRDGKAGARMGEVVPPCRPPVTACNAHTACAVPFPQHVRVRHPRRCLSGCLFHDAQGRDATNQGRNVTNRGRDAADQGRNIARKG